MELPTYHMPGLKNLMLHLWDKAKHFIQKAFTVILLSCVIVRLLSTFSWDWTYVGEEMDRSILTSLGQFIQPIFTPLGFGKQLSQDGWVFAVAAITGLIAKEDVIATFCTLALCFGANAANGGIQNVEHLIEHTGISPAAVLAFIVFNMLTLPCFAALATAKGEVGKGKFKWTVLFWAVTSYIGAALVYTVGEFVWPIAIWLVVIALAVVGIVLYNKYMDKKEARERLLKR
jgi:ferrous iron transport protein B